MGFHEEYLLWFHRWLLGLYSQCHYLDCLGEAVVDDNDNNVGVAVDRLCKHYFWLSN